MDFYKVQEEILRAKMRKKCLQLSNILVKAETFLSVVSIFFREIIAQCGNLTFFHEINFLAQKS